jgi:hypothetical protein
MANGTMANGKEFNFFKTPESFLHFAEVAVMCLEALPWQSC